MLRLQVLVPLFSTLLAWQKEKWNMVRQKIENCVASLYILSPLCPRLSFRWNSTGWKEIQMCIKVKSRTLSEHCLSWTLFTFPLKISFFRIWGGVLGYDTYKCALRICHPILRVPTLICEDQDLLCLVAKNIYENPRA